MLPDDHYFLHQRAIFEIQSHDGDLRFAEELLDKSKRLAPWDDSIMHSFAELELRWAMSAESKDSMEAHLRRVRSLAVQLTGPNAKSAAGFHTLAKAGLFRLRSADATLEDATPDYYWKIVRDIEETLQEGLQRFPGEAFLLDSEAQLRGLTADDQAVLHSLERAFNANPDNSYIAIRLARHLESILGFREAADVLEKAMESGAGEKYLHYYYGVLLESLPDTNPTVIEYHLRQGFTEGDQNFEAQYRYARRLYINGKVGESRNRFASLLKANSGAKANRRLRDPIVVNGNPVVFTGTISRLESDFALITRDGFADQVFMHISDVSEDVWGTLAQNLRVEFAIGFNWKGTLAFNVKPERTGQVGTR